MAQSSKINPLSCSSGGYPIVLNAIPLHSSTATFCPIGKFCKVTPFSRIVQVFFRDYKSTRPQDHKWAVAGCFFKTTSQRDYKSTSRAVAGCFFKTTSQRDYKSTSRAVAGCFFKTTSQRDYKSTSRAVAGCFFKTTSQRDYKSTSRAVAGCFFKTTSQRDYKSTSRAVADGFKTTSQRVNRTTSRAVAVLPFDFRLFSFTLCLSTIKKTENSTLLARPHPCISRIPYKGDTDVIYLGVGRP